LAATAKAEQIGGEGGDIRSSYNPMINIAAPPLDPQIFAGTTAASFQTKLAELDGDIRNITTELSNLATDMRGAMGDYDLGNTSATQVMNGVQTGGGTPLMGSLRGQV
jgi:hypothetical protein